MEKYIIFFEKVMEQSEVIKRYVKSSLSGFTLEEIDDAFMDVIKERWSQVKKGNVEFIEKLIGMSSIRSYFAKCTAKK